MEPGIRGGESESTPESSSRIRNWTFSIAPEVLELDRAFEAVEHPRRRYLLYALADNPEWTLTELTTKLTAWEQDVDESEVDADSHDRVYLSLYHAHVPKLVDMGMVHFDPETETISTAEHAEQAMAVLEGAGASLDTEQEQHAQRGYEGKESGHEQD